LPVEPLASAASALPEARDEAHVADAIDDQPFAPPREER